MAKRSKIPEGSKTLDLDEMDDYNDLTVDGFSQDDDQCLASDDV